MVSLVAAEYGSSSSSESDDEETEDCVTRDGLASTNAQKTLVNPFRSSPGKILTGELPFLPPVLAANQNLPSMSVSAFSNPYQEEENAKQSVLEKHVKMTPNTVKQNSINGRQVCWNYRKGRCRFGHNCKFVHDSDLLITNSTPDDVPSSPNANEQKISIQTHRKRKKRPGLSQGLIPSKKVMKSFYKHQKQESITSK